MKEEVASTFDVKTNAIYTIKTASPSKTAIALKTALAPKAKAKQQKKWTAQSKCPRTLRLRNMEQFGTLAEMKMKFSQLFLKIKLVRFLTPGQIK